MPEGSLEGEFEEEKQEITKETKKASDIDRKKMMPTLMIPYEPWSPSVSGMSA